MLHSEQLGRLHFISKKQPEDSLVVKLQGKTKGCQSTEKYNRNKRVLLDNLASVTDKQSNRSNMTFRILKERLA